MYEEAPPDNTPVTYELSESAVTVLKWPALQVKL